MDSRGQHAGASNGRSSPSALSVGDARVDANGAGRASRAANEPRGSLPAPCPRPPSQHSPGSPQEPPQGAQVPPPVGKRGFGDGDYRPRRRLRARSTLGGDSDLVRLSLDPGSHTDDNPVPTCKDPTQDLREEVGTRASPGANELARSGSRARTKADTSFMVCGGARGSRG